MFSKQSKFSALDVVDGETFLTAFNEHSCICEKSHIQALHNARNNHIYRLLLSVLYILNGWCVVNFHLNCKSTMVSVYLSVVVVFCITVYCFCIFFRFLSLVVPLTCENCILFLFCYVFFVAFIIIICIVPKMLKLCIVNDNKNKNNTISSAQHTQHTTAPHSKLTVLQKQK